MRIPTGILISFFFFFGLLGIVFSSNAQPSKFGAGYYVENADSLAYRMMEPDYNPHRKFPLVVFLHGSGERGSDNDTQLKWGLMNFATPENMSRYPAFVLAPQCPSQDSWSPYDEDIKNPPEKKSMRLLIALIQKLIKEGRVDPSRIYLTGLSMGGFGTFDALQRYPDLFAAAVPVCGGGNPVLCLIVKR
jgi:predicted peptidase